MDVTSRYVGIESSLASLLLLAQKGDRPPFKVMGNEQLIEIAKTRPVATADFATIKGIDLAYTLRRVNHVAMNANYSLSWARGTGVSWKNWCRRTPRRRWIVSRRARA